MIPCDLSRSRRRCAQTFSKPQPIALVSSKGKHEVVDLASEADQRPDLDEPGPACDDAALLDDDRMVDVGVGRACRLGEVESDARLDAEEEVGEALGQDDVVVGVTTKS